MAKDHLQGCFWSDSRRHSRWRIDSDGGGGDGVDGGATFACRGSNELSAAQARVDQLTLELAQAQEEVRRLWKSSVQQMKPSAKVTQTTDLPFYLSYHVEQACGSDLGLRLRQITCRKFATRPVRIGEFVFTSVGLERVVLVTQKQTKD
eukprot:m.231087 g.231087  ORF g.231087 m.231087 type:complete len:149 (+) comp15686_c0_seq5:1925-2371(+)